MSVSNHGGAQLAEAVRHAYAAGQDDYHLEPMVLAERGVPAAASGITTRWCSAAAGVSGRSS